MAMNDESLISGSNSNDGMHAPSGYCRNGIAEQSPSDDPILMYVTGLPVLLSQYAAAKMAPASMPVTSRCMHVRAVAAGTTEARVASGEVCESPHSRVRYASIVTCTLLL